MGPGVPRSRERGPVRSRSIAVSAMARTAAIAGPVAAGSVASASTSTVGRSPRRIFRVKSSGMFTTNWTFPSRSSRSTSASESVTLTSLK